MQLYIAGTDTTSSNLYWAFLYVAKYPEIQQRIYEEISEHVGLCFILKLTVLLGSQLFTHTACISHDLSGSRSVNYADRNSMHFTTSFITEVFRLAAAFGSLIHCSSEDISIRGHMIPKGQINSSVQRAYR